MRALRAALGWKAGLWRLRKGGIANELVLRGLQSRDLNVLIGGHRVYGACPNHMDPPGFHVDFAEVERVEIGKGPFDVKNQDALGGTFNVVTRNPRRDGTRRRPWRPAPSASSTPLSRSAAKVVASPRARTTARKTPSAPRSVCRNRDGASSRTSPSASEAPPGSDGDSRRPVTARPR